MNSQSGNKSIRRVTQVKKHQQGCTTLQVEIHEKSDVIRRVYIPKSISDKKSSDDQ